MNKEEEVKVAKENMERLEKVKKENKKRVEKMKQENKIRMMLVFQENAALEEKLVAKLQEQEQALRSPKPTIKERAAPECPVSRKQFTSSVNLYNFIQYAGQVCLEEMLPPRKIFQCRNGHLLCGDCRLAQFNFVH